MTPSSLSVSFGILFPSHHCACRLLATFPRTLITLLRTNLASSRYSVRVAFTTFSSFSSSLSSSPWMSYSQMSLLLSIMLCRLFSFLIPLDVILPDEPFTVNHAVPVVPAHLVVAGGLHLVVGVVPLLSPALVGHHPLVRVPQPQGDVQLGSVLARGHQVAEAEGPVDLELLDEDTGLGLGGDDHLVALLVNPLLRPWQRLGILGQTEGKQEEKKHCEGSADDISKQQPLINNQDGIKK